MSVLIAGLRLGGATRRWGALVLELVSTLASVAIVLGISEATGDPRSVAGTYAGFAVVGVLSLRVVQVALATPVHHVLRRRASGALDLDLAGGAPAALVLVAPTLLDVVRAVAVVGIGTVAAAVLGPVEIRFTPAGVLGATAGLGILAVSALLLGIALQAVAVLFARTIALAGLLAIAVALLCGVWYPLDVLPAPLRVIAAALPTTHAIDLLRNGLDGRFAAASAAAGTVTTAVLGVLVPPLAEVVVTAARNRGRTL